MRKTIHYILVIVSLCSCVLLWGQKDSIYSPLNEVVLTHHRLKTFSDGQQLTTLSDTILRRNDRSLTDLLRFNAPIYLREQGVSGVSSASFRGTSAAQTAVLWNGININSQTTGQTDFNTITTDSFDEVVVKSGGGSVQSGSGAIGGSVHLNNTLQFGDGYQQIIQASLGSFGQQKGYGKGMYSNEIFVVEAGVGYTESENDYRFLSTDVYNDNSAIQYRNFDLNAAYKFNKRHQLSLFHQTFLSDREFSGTYFPGVYIASEDRYENKNTRSLLQWEYQQNRFDLKVIGAHLYEEYGYFPVLNKEAFGYGKVITYNAKVDAAYQPSKDIEVGLVIDAKRINADGSNIGSAEERDQIEFVGFSKYQLLNNLNLGIQAKHVANNQFQIDPVLALDVNYQPTDWYTLKGNASKNYRIPTFNDLYWQGGGQGNPNLTPERAQQLEITNAIDIHGFTYSITNFYIETENLIRWIPTAAGTTPINIDRTKNIGIEVNASVTQNHGDHSWSVGGIYTYTEAKDLETNEPLIFIPKHKQVFLATYGYKFLDLYYQHLFDGEVPLQSGGSRELPKYDVGNVGVSGSFTLLDQIDCTTTFKVRNLYNEIYQNSSGRPMPPRNYQLQTIIKF